MYARDNDEDDFAQKIVELLDDPERRLRMGTAGLNRLKSELSWDHSTVQLLKCYARLRGH